MLQTLTFLKKCGNIYLGGLEYNKMGFLSWFKRKKKEEDLYYPTGFEIVHKYNIIVEAEQLNPKSWLAYIGDNE
jgi:hypothetical protein